MVTGCARRQSWWRWMGAVPPNLGAQWAQWEGVVDLKQWDDFIFLANLLGSEVSRVKVKWMRVKNEIPKKKLQDKSPRVGYVFDSRPSANMWYDQAWLKIVSPKTGHSNTKHLASHFGLPLAQCWNPEIISLYTTDWDHHFCSLNRPGAWRSGAGLLFPAWWTRLWSGANGSISIRDQVLSLLHSTRGGCDGCLGWYYLANVKPGFWQFLQFIMGGYQFQ